MCPINILLLLTEIVQTLAGLMRIAFIANDSVNDAKLAAMPLGDKIQIKLPLDSNPGQSRREATLFAQKTFQLICNLINAPVESDKDLKLIREIAPRYIELLTRTVLSTPQFVKAESKPVSERMFRDTLERISELGWNDIKNDLIACEAQIFSSAH